MRGLLAPLAVKNGWTLAEAAGDITPDGMQRLLNAAAWDADGVRDDIRDYAIGHLGVLRGQSQHDGRTAHPRPAEIKASYDLGNVSSSSARVRRSCFCARMLARVSTSI